MSEAPKCGCGRSPTGNCIGWHALSKRNIRRKKLNMKQKKLASNFTRAVERSTARDP